MRSAYKHYKEREEEKEKKLKESGRDPDRPWLYEPAHKAHAKQNKKRKRKGAAYGWDGKKMFYLLFFSVTNALQHFE